jgi:hypothetical protein
MKMRNLGLGLALASLALAGTAAAQTRPGVGYDPQARGLTVSRYQLDNLNSPFLSHSIDFNARPDLVGAAPNAYYLNFGDPLVRAAIELRWGAGTSTTHFKRWQGPGNEVKFILHDALVWAFREHPEMLGGDTSNRNGEPTEVEMIDIQATNDRALWFAYFQNELEGYSPEHRATVCDAKLPAGDGEYTDPFWGIQFYYHNNFQAPPPFSPQIPASQSCTPSH